MKNHQNMPEEAKKCVFKGNHRRRIDRKCSHLHWRQTQG